MLVSSPHQSFVSDYKIENTDYLQKGCRVSKDVNKGYPMLAIHLICHDTKDLRSFILILFS